MNLTSLIRKLESQLKNAEKLARHYDNQAKALSKRLSTVAKAVGKVVLGKSAKGGMSAAGRKRIAAAQRKRWAKFHAKQRSKKTAKTQAKKSDNPF